LAPSGSITPTGSPALLLCAALAALCFLFSAGGAWADTIDLQTTRVALKPSDPGQRDVGKLRFRGGLVLESSDPRFGGLSGMVVSADGRSVLAVSDAAYWVSFKLYYRDVDLVGADKAQLWPMRNLDGEPMQLKAGDAESLTALSSRGLAGDVAVGFEGNARIWRYAFGTKHGDALPTPVPAPPELKTVRRNKGLEAMARLPDGRLLALTEATLNDAGNMIGWILDGPNSTPISYKRHEDYDLSDLCILPDGDALALERRLSIPQGLFMRLRRIPAASIKPHAVLDGPVIAALDPTYTIDNMEGVAARKDRHGETLIYVISDDNYNRLERTILLVFALNTEKPAQARAR
jgi:hypothetical protein